MITKRHFLIKTLVIALSALCTSTAALAGALVTIKGELYSMSNYDCLIKTPVAIYRINRELLSSAQIRQIEAPGASGRPIDLEVPMEAIKGIRTLEKTANK
jgi:hypothetical protein